MDEERALAVLRVGTALAVVTTWVAAMIASAVTAYDPPSLVLSGPVALVLGYLFRVTRPNGADSGGGDGK